MLAFERQLWLHSIPSRMYGLLCSWLMHTVLLCCLSMSHAECSTHASIPAQFLGRWVYTLHLMITRTNTLLHFPNARGAVKGPFTLCPRGYCLDPRIWHSISMTTPNVRVPTNPRFHWQQAQIYHPSYPIHNVS
ncbi:hypothetical protein EI94DRAFT_1734433 [Lactarius quietus]|nr:hypothetical protein EI94DRAFT_1734433 [Lactarius quietus]